MNEIQDLKVKFISIVKAGANQKEIIYKDAKFSERLRVDFAKSNEELGVVYGIVYAPNEVDTQGDFANAKEITKAAYEFMRENSMHCVDVNHNFEKTNAFICESWIVKKGDEMFKEVGAWAVGIKLEDENLKKLVKSGELKGLSMYGYALKEQNAEQKMDNKEQTKDSEQSKIDELSKLIEEMAIKVEALSAELKEQKESISAILNRSKQNEEVKKQEISQSWGIL